MGSKGGRQISSFFVFKVVLLILVLIVLLTLVAHHALSSLAVSDTPVNSHKTRTQLEYYSDQDAVNPKIMSSLQNEIEELRNIKISVNNELRDLGNRRLKLQSDISGYSTTIDRLKVEQTQLNKEVQHIQLSLEQIKFEQEESKAFIPNIKAPTRILEDLDPTESLPSPNINDRCRMESCFDFSRCSLVSKFPVYFYEPQNYFINGVEFDPVVEASFSQFLVESAYKTLVASKACIFVVLVGEIKTTSTVSAKDIESFLFSLPHWRGDGRNHVLINVGRSLNNQDLFDGVNIGRAMRAQSVFTHTPFRQDFDMLIPVSLSSTPAHEVWKDLPPLSPIRRKYLMSYAGQYFSGEDGRSRRSADSNTNSLSNNFGQKDENIRQEHQQQELQNDDKNKNMNNVPKNIQHRRSANIGRDNNLDNRLGQHRRLLSSVVDSSQSTSAFSFYSHIEQSIVSSIKSFQTNYPDKFHIEVSCHASTHSLISSSRSIVPSDWLLCPPSQTRREWIRQSTFNLIIPPLNNSYYSTVSFQTRVLESIQNGAVPVILGSHGHLPLAQVLHWNTAAITLPTPRVTEIPFFLLSIPDEDIASFRLQGRQFYLNHFGSVQSILDSVLAVIRSRLQIPAVPIQGEEYRTAFPAGFVPLKYDGPELELETDEILGPVESPFPSEAYKHNYTQVSSRGDAFNNLGDPFHLYPYTPFTPVLPSEAKFLGSNYGYRPVDGGAGGDGTTFSQSLGGNYPREQFTIVMLTYDREVVLIQALQRFKGLPYLNKVVVVWNNPEPPADDLKWPDVGVPVKVAKTKRNSLNNRFLPYDVIDTEAILSIDDDAHLRHDEIVFGFRVWREERDRVVGFPGRFHAWDVKHKSWNYNSNYSCELSMVLTGAAFFHKYYAYQYSYVMPQAIRDKVDEYMNCEDIAMNFLVAHISRQPPVKVTSRWTFRCPGCPTTLSSNSSHFEERHACINFFSQVYGYTPLLYTQYRVDSVLFKTRISHDKTKCFKYI